MQYGRKAFYSPFFASNCHGSPIKYNAHSFSHLTPQKCSRVVFATCLSKNAKNERTTIKIFKNWGTITMV
jgi:hypothetical protein